MITSLLVIAAAALFAHVSAIVSIARLLLQMTSRLRKRKAGSSLRIGLGVMVVSMVVLLFFRVRPLLLPFIPEKGLDGAWNWIYLLLDPDLMGTMMRDVFATLALCGFLLVLRGVQFLLFGKKEEGEFNGVSGHIRKPPKMTAVALVGLLFVSCETSLLEPVEGLVLTVAFVVALIFVWKRVWRSR